MQAVCFSVGGGGGFSGAVVTSATVVGSGRGVSNWSLLAAAATCNGVSNELQRCNVGHNKFIYRNTSKILTAEASQIPMFPLASEILITQHNLCKTIFT